MNFKAITMSVLLLASLNSMAASFIDITLLPLASSMTTSGDMKEQHAIIVSDAVDFLAGNEASEILVETFSQLRATRIDLEDLTDQEIAQLIVTQ